MKNINEKMETLLNNEEFVSAMAYAETTEEAAQIMTEYGIEMTADQVEEMIQAARNYLLENNYATEDGELTEAGLELVAGGRWGVKARTYVYFAGEVGCVGAIVCGVAAGPVGWACLGAAAVCGMAATISMLH